MIKEDLKHKAQCFYGRSTGRDILKVLFTDGTSAVVLFRMAKFFQGMGLGLVGWLFLEINKFLNGCVIGRGVYFQEGLVLMHPIGVVINGGVKGGKNVVIESGVVIGTARHGFPVEVPTIGNDVFIGAGAKILGGITIGNHVKIGANAVVLKDVPDGVTVVGIPAKTVNINNLKI